MNYGFVYDCELAQIVYKLTRLKGYGTLAVSKLADTLFVFNFLPL